MKPGNVLYIDNDSQSWILPKGFKPEGSISMKEDKVRRNKTAEELLLEAKLTGYAKEMFMEKALVISTANGTTSINSFGYGQMELLGVLEFFKNKQVATAGYTVHKKGGDKK